MKTTKISNLYAGNANKANGQTLEASEWNALSAAARDAQTAVNSIFADTVVLTNASQAAAANKVYSVQSSIDLNGGTLTMPAGCTLLFEGGSISNGSLVLNNTRIEGNASFSNVTISGSCANEVLTPQMFGAKAELTASSNNATRDTLGFLNLVTVLGNVGTMSKMVHIPAGHYALNQPVLFSADCTVYGDGDTTVIDGYAGQGVVWFGTSEGEYSERCQLIAGCTITANVATNDKTITVNDASDIDAGDYLVVTDTVNGSLNQDRRYYRQGEVMKVASKEGNVLTLSGTAYGNYFVEFGANDEHSINDAPLYRTVISKLTAGKYDVHDFKIVTHEYTQNNMRSYSFYVGCFKDSRFENITVENHGNRVAACFALGIDFLVERCTIKNESEAGISDQYGGLVMMCQDFHFNDCTFKAPAHALATGGADIVTYIVNRNFIYENLHFDTPEPNSNVELDVHGNAENYKYLNIDAPYTTCDTGGINVTVEGCRFKHISTSFHIGGLTIRNCEIESPVKNLTSLGQASTELINKNIVVENCLIKGFWNWDFQQQDVAFDSFIWRNNVCYDGVQVYNGKADTVRIEDNVFNDGDVLILTETKNVVVRGNTVKAGVVQINVEKSNGQNADAIITNNILHYDGLTPDGNSTASYGVYLKNLDCHFLNNNCSVAEGKAPVIVYGTSSVKIEDCIFKKGTAEKASGEIVRATDSANVVFNHNVHNSTSDSVVTITSGNPAKVKLGYHPTVSTVDGNTKVTDAIGETVYARDVNKMGFVGSMNKTYKGQKAIASGSNSTVFANTMTEKDKTYRGVFSAASSSSILAFSKTENANEEDLLVVGSLGAGETVCLFDAPDPTVYPYIYVSVGRTDGVTVSIYENRSAFDYDGAPFNVNRFGATGNRPTEGLNLYRGFKYFDTTLGKPIYVKSVDYTNGQHVPSWYEADGVIAGTKRSGTFAEKPNAANAVNGIYVGFRYFCTDKQTTEGQTNGIEIIWNGTAWVDALGRTVS